MLTIFSVDSSNSSTLSDRRTRIAPPESYTTAAPSSASDGRIEFVDNTRCDVGTSVSASTRYGAVSVPPSNPSASAWYTTRDPSSEIVGQDDPPSDAASSAISLVRIVDGSSGSSAAVQRWTLAGAGMKGSGATASGGPDSNTIAVASADASSRRPTT
ncbi:MAG: hypothetical protein HKN44_13215 [Ilumatobacter sp.]|nr:hypothetical protein [Ilumatobacter sp.]